VVNLNINLILNKYSDQNYKIFQEKICKTKYIILGIKIPILRKITKELLKKYEYTTILNNLDNKYFEHIMIKGFIIANINIDYKKRIQLIDAFLDEIDNWAICDLFVSELKFIKNNYEEFFSYATDLITRKKEYHIRLGIVILLNYYINDTYIDLVLKKMLEINSEFYYVKMATSWCLSICLIKYFSKTKSFLEDNKNSLDKWTYNKALQKGIESTQISQENKNILKEMKR